MGLAEYMVVAQGDEWGYGLGDNLSIDAELGFAADVSRTESGESPP